MAKQELFCIVVNVHKWTLIVCPIQSLFSIQGLVPRIIMREIF